MPAHLGVRAAASGMVLLLAAAAAACAPQESGGTAATASSGAAACDKATLKTVKAGGLTLATDDPAYPPWIVDNKPDTGEGFEGAVAYAVATKLGYSAGEVSWVRVPFNNAIAPGPKNFDFDINQFSISDERKKAVDFSSPYYDVRQTVITVKGSPIAGATSLAALKKARLGAQVGTTSYQALTTVIAPDAKPLVYNNNDDAKKALENGQVDGIVVDLPTAFYITSAELDNGVIVGQLPKSAAAEQFGLLLDKGSALTACVSRAVDALRADGTLAQLEQKWLAQTAGAPELS
jgi:polar amino acid transport system substrate-binding protein